MDRLDLLSKEKQAALVEALWERQSSSDGLFRFGDFRRSELFGRNQGHSATYLQLQGTYFAIHALDALQAIPKYRIELAQKLSDIGYVRGWLSAGMWFNPWLQSNYVMFALAFLELEHRVYRNRQALRAMSAALQFLDERQDAQSGLWQPDDGENMENAVFAAYHFLPYYFWLGRCPEFSEQIVDSVLSVQGAHGGFGANPSGACEDLDAIHTLAYMRLVTDYRHSEIQHAVRRCANRIFDLQNVDGGFPNYPKCQLRRSLKRRVAEAVWLDKLLRRPAYVLKSHYSGWATLVVTRGGSDMWGAWFRPLALRLAYEVCGVDLGSACDCGFRRLPGLGWHDRALIAQTAPARKDMAGAK